MDYQLLVLMLAVFLKLLDEENGYCCEAGDIDGYVDGIIQILSNREMRNRYSAGSMNIIRSRYSLEYHLQQLEKIYESVL